MLRGLLHTILLCGIVLASKVRELVFLHYRWSFALTPPSTATGHRSLAMWDAPIDQTGISDWPVSVRYIRSAPQQEASPNRKKPKCAYLCILNLSLSGQCESLYYDLPSFTAMTDTDVTLVDDRMCCNLFHCFLFVFLYFCFTVARVMNCVFTLRMGICITFSPFTKKSPWYISIHSSVTGCSNILTRYFYQ